MIYKINNHAYVDLDRYLDIDSLLAMKEELCHAFTEAWLGLGKGNQALPAVAGHPDNWPNSVADSGEKFLPQHEGKELSGVLYKTLHDKTALGHAKVKEFIEKGHPSYANMFLKLIGDNQGIGYNLYIRQPVTNNYGEKHLAEKTKESFYHDRFAFFLDWVRAQKIFSEIGRVVIFFNDQDQYCLVHRDHNQHNPVDNPDEFVWINVFLDRKKFYLLDGETGHKEYINSHVAWFDTANWHGSDPNPYAAFSIRVDGIFTKSWCKKIKFKRKEIVAVPPAPAPMPVQKKSKSKNLWQQAAKD